MNLREEFVIFIERIHIDYDYAPVAEVCKSSIIARWFMMIQESISLIRADTTLRSSTSQQFQTEIDECIKKNKFKERQQLRAYFRKIPWEFQAETFN